jgi:4-hydroxy-tetrahydrodipicolinate synthase
MNRPVLGELLTAMVTPFAGDGSVSHDAARRMARHLIDSGSDGVVVCGTTGEGPTVSDREKLDLLEVITAEVGSAATVIANTGTYDTHHSVALTRAALESGVDGFLAVTPYYNKPPRAGIVAHFAAIAEAADGRPVIIYNIPQRVVVNLEPDLLAELDKIPNVVAVKQATPDLDQARRIMLETNLALYAGNDDLVYPFLQLGAIGGVCVASHVAGPQLRRMIDLAHSGDMVAAGAENEALHDLFEALTMTTNPIPIKAALNLLGHDVGGLRLPLVDADASQTATVAAALEAAGIQPVDRV